MKSMKSMLLLTGLLTTSVFANSVTLTFTNLGPAPKGNIAIAIFNEGSGFPDTKQNAVYTGSVKVQTPETKVTIELPAGDYAISAFLDENKNAKLDTNLVGIPKERFGFSNNPKVTFSAPNYSECLVVVQPGKSLKTTIKMLKFL